MIAQVCEVNFAAVSEPPLKAQVLSVDLASQSTGLPTGEVSCSSCTGGKPVVMQSFPVESDWLEPVDVSGLTPLFDCTDPTEAHPDADVVVEYCESSGTEFQVSVSASSSEDFSLCTSPLESCGVYAEQFPEFTSYVHSNFEHKLQWYFGEDLDNAFFAESCSLSSTDGSDDLATATIRSDCSEAFNLSAGTNEQYESTVNLVAAALQELLAKQCTGCMHAGEQPSAEVQPEKELRVPLTEVDFLAQTAGAESHMSPQYDALPNKCITSSIPDVALAGLSVEQPLSTDPMISENCEVSGGGLSTSVVVSVADQLDKEYAYVPEVVKSYGFLDYSTPSPLPPTRGKRAKRTAQRSEIKRVGSSQNRDDLLFWAAKAKRNSEKNAHGGDGQHKRCLNDGIGVFSDSSASEQGGDVDSNNSCTSNDSCVATVSGKTNFALGARIAATLPASGHGNALRLSFRGIQGDIGTERVKRRTERRRRNAERLRCMTQQVKNRSSAATLQEQPVRSVNHAAITAAGDLVKCNDIRLRNINSCSRSSDAPVTVGRKRLTYGDATSGESPSMPSGGRSVLKKMKLPSKSEQPQQILPFGFCTQEELNAEPIGKLESVMTSTTPNDAVIPSVRAERKHKKKSRKDRPNSVVNLFCEGFSTAPHVVKEQYLASCKRSVTKEFILLQKRRDRGEIDNCSFERQKDHLMAQVVPAPENPVPEHLRRMWVAESPTPTQEPSHRSRRRGAELFRRREKLLRVSRAIDQRAPPSERLEHRDTSFSDMSMAEKMRLERSWRFWPIHGERFEAFGWNFAQPAHPLFKHPERYPRC